MNSLPNGINMSDVKKANRSSILWTIYYSNGISRKEIAIQLGLTPAAITLITNDMIAEGLLIESEAVPSEGRKGRKEILLQIKSDAYVTVGVYISKKSFQIICCDLHCNILFDKVIYTADCNYQSSIILNKVISILKTNLKEYDVLRNRTLLGIGVCVHGIVDSRNGISINSYGIWEENAPVFPVLKEAFHVPIVLTNNICALAHGESFMMQNQYPDEVLFIKYGPGVGASRTLSVSSRNIYDYKSVEIGHMMVDPNGSPCICGSNGCLETIASYRAIEQSLIPLINEHQTPVLYRLIHGSVENITISAIMESYSNGESATISAVNRAIYYLALSIRNSVCLFKSKRVILYGEVFENSKFQEELNRLLSVFFVKTNISYSHYNSKLTALGPATTIISQLFESGGNFNF